MIARFTRTMICLPVFWLVLQSCSLFPGSGFNPSVGLLDKSGQTMPNITPTAMKMKSMNGPSGPLKFINPWGGLEIQNIFDSYMLFRSFDTNQEIGYIGNENIYECIFQIENAMANAAYAQKFSSPKTIAAPYRFGDSVYDAAVSYDYGYFATSSGSPQSGGTWYYTNTLAYSTNSGWVYGLAAASQTEVNTGEASRNCQKFQFNAATGDITLFLVWSSELNSAVTSCGRAKITGNFLTHEFFIHMQLPGGGPTASNTQLVGKGISRGSGNYYVIYIKNPQMQSANWGYYRFPAGWVEADFQNATNLAATASVAGLTNDSSGYGTAIQTYVNGGGLFTNDIRVSDFANGGLLNLN